MDYGVMFDYCVRGFACGVLIGVMLFVRQPAWALHALDVVEDWCVPAFEWCARVLRRLLRPPRLEL